MSYLEKYFNHDYIILLAAYKIIGYLLHELRYSNIAFPT